MTARQVLIDLDFNGLTRLLNLPDAASDQEPVTLAQLKAAIEGLAWKDNVRVATQANLNLASPGSAIDGITMAVNDRVLVRNQTSQPDNGLYIWNGAAVVMTRALDANSAVELEQAVVTVDEGTDAGATYRQQTVNFTLGSGNVVWGSFGVTTPDASETTKGKAELATQAETDTGTDDARIVTPLKLATWSGRKLKYATDIGDGSATSYVVTHNLGTRDLQATIRRNSGNYDEVLADVQFTSTTTATITFAAAPTSNQFRVILLG